MAKWLKGAFLMHGHKTQLSEIFSVAVQPKSWSARRDDSSDAMGPLVGECGHWGLAVVTASFTVHLLVKVVTRCAGVLFLSFQNEFQSSTAQTGAIFSIMSSSSYIGSKNYLSLATKNNKVTTEI